MYLILTRWGQDKIDTISQTTFSNAFTWMKMNEFALGFDRRLFLRFESTIFHHWFRQWLGADQATSHYLNQWRLIYWCIYASLGLNELNAPSSQAFYIEHVPRQSAPPDTQTQSFHISLQHTHNGPQAYLLCSSTFPSVINCPWQRQRH